MFAEKMGTSEVAATETFLGTPGMSFSGRTQTYRLILYKLSLKGGKRPKADIKEFRVRLD
jgi:hypothetical protein